MKKAIIYILISVCILSACTTQPTEEGIDLYGTYNENDLIINSITEAYNDKDIKIPCIEGLKDTAIQDKINEEIYTEAKNLVNKYSDLNYANYYTYASFANVVSITFTVGFDHEPYSQQLYFNYNLTNGEKLKLEDLFMKDADLLGIVRSSFYKSMSVFGAWDFENNRRIFDENLLYKTVKNYMAKEEKTFAFSPSEIFFYEGAQMASAKMTDYADCISIYSKYLTEESIFTGEYPGYKGIFTCADSQYDLFDTIEYGYMEDNLWYDLTVGSCYIPFDDPPSSEREEKFKSFCQAAIEDERQSLEDYRTIAKANPDKFYIVLSKPSVDMDLDSEYEDGKWHYTYYDTATVNTHIQLFEMPIELYETVYKDKIIETYRYEYFAMRGGAWLDTENTDGAVFSEITDSYTHNYMEG